MKKNGFTIVELLLYIGLLTIFMTIVTRLFTGITDEQLSAEAAGAVEQDSRFLYNRFAYDIPRASGIVNAGSSLTLVIDGVQISYQLNNGNLLRLGDALNSAGTRISDLSFSQVGKSVQMKFTITSTTQTVRGADSKTIETTIALR